MKPSRQSGLTLPELLVALVLLAALALLGVTQIRASAQRARQINCTQNLRQISAILHSYAAERNGKLKFFLDGAGHMMWYDELRLHAQLGDIAAKKLFGCPAVEWSDNMAWRCYGMRLTNLTPPPTPDVGRIERSSTSGYYTYRLSQIAEPARFLVMADSGSLAGPQTFRLASRKLYAGGGVTLRHLQRANVLFLDGHVESLSAPELFDFGFHELVDGDNRLISR